MAKKNEFLDLDEFGKKKKDKKKKKKGSKIGKILIYLLVAVVISFFMSKYNVNIKDVIDKISGKQKEAPSLLPQEAEVPLVKVFHVIRTDFEDNLPVVGTVKGIREVDMRFETNGVIRKMNFQEGDLVSIDEILAELDKREVKLKIDYQRANFEAAQASFLGASKKLANTEKLFGLGGVLVSKLDEAILEADNAAAKMRSAQVEVKSAEHELTKTVLNATTPGVVGVLHMEEGEYVTSSDKVITIIDIAMVFIDLGIIEKDINRIALGLPVKVKVDAYPDMTFEGEISNILPVVEGKSRTLTAKVEVSNEENLLLPGMFARADIAVFEDTDTIMIPMVALNKQTEGYTVNVVSPENIIEQRDVKVGYITTEYVQVLEGLEVDEFIVVETQAELKSGDKVQIMEIQESTLK